MNEFAKQAQYDAMVDAECKLLVNEVTEFLTYREVRTQYIITKLIPATFADHW